MPTYRAPVADVQFLLKDVFGWELYSNLPGFSDATADVVEAVLREGAKFCEEVLQPLNLSGDREGCKQLADGSVVEIGPRQDPELYWATAGGMGLTGVILDATIRCPRIGSSRVLVDTDRAPDLDSVVELMATGDANYDYSVAWIDLMATGASMGRSVLTRGRFATADELGTAPGSDPFDYRAGVIASAPPFVPGGLLNKLTVRAFNELWFRKAPKERRDELQTIPTFFHPLDMVGGWNRIYGPGGFLQWQFVIPFGTEATLRRIIEELSAAGCTSFLAVLKAFGPSNDSPLSFPAPGWTLALDIPTGVPGR